MEKVEGQQPTVEYLTWGMVMHCQVTSLPLHTFQMHPQLNTKMNSILMTFQALSMEITTNVQKETIKALFKQYIWLEVNLQK